MYTLEQVKNMISPPALAILESGNVYSEFSAEATKVILQQTGLTEQQLLPEAKASFVFILEYLVHNAMNATSELYKEKVTNNYNVALKLLTKIAENINTSTAKPRVGRMYMPYSC